MAKKAVVTVNSMHVCPMVTGMTSHVGGPVVGPGCPGILIDGQPISVIGDMCTCVGPPDTVIQGCSGILADGVPIVIQNSMTAHGGMVTQGVAGVMVDTAAPLASLPTQEIQFPEITFPQKVLSKITGTSKLLAEAEKNIEELKEQTDEQCYLPDFDISI